MSLALQSQRIYGALQRKRLRQSTGKCHLLGGIFVQQTPLKVACQLFKAICECNQSDAGCWIKPGMLNPELDPLPHGSPIVLRVLTCFFNALQRFFPGSTAAYTWRAREHFCQVGASNGGHRTNRVGQKLEKTVNICWEPQLAEHHGQNLKCRTKRTAFLEALSWKVRSDDDVIEQRSVRCAQQHLFAVECIPITQIVGHPARSQ